MSIPFTLRIPDAFVERLVVQARSELPNECCGLIAGDPATGAATALFPLVNELASPTEFLSEPRGLFEAHRAMRQQQIEVLAVYHSHPTSPPRPSRADIERNYGDNVMTIILSLAGAVPEIKAWWLTPEVREAAWTTCG